MGSAPLGLAEPVLDVERVEILVRRRIAGERAVMEELTDCLCRFLGPALQRTRMLASARAEDAPREVMTRVLEKLTREDARALRQSIEWVERHPGKGLQDWLVILMTNAAREHLRELHGRRKTPEEEPSRKRFLNQLVSIESVPGLGIRPPFTPQQTARQVVEFARSHLPADQLSALEHWLEGAEPEEIATAMGLRSREAAQRLVRAATATLRRRFAPANGQ